MDFVEEQGKGFAEDQPEDFAEDLGQDFVEDQPVDCLLVGHSLVAGCSDLAHFEPAPLAQVACRFRPAWTHPKNDA